MSDWRRDKRLQEEADRAEEARVRKEAKVEDERLRREGEAEDARLRASAEAMQVDDGLDRYDPADAACRRLVDPGRDPEREEKGLE